MTKKIDNIMCKETEKLVKLLQGRDNPTDMALLILANKIDILDSKLNSLNQSTEFARWLESHKKKNRVSLNSSDRACFVRFI